MRFTRYGKYEPTPVITPRKLAHARKVVQADADSVALFPELRRETTAEARLERLAHHREQWLIDRRRHIASSWLAARRRLRALPPLQKAAVIRYWQRGSLPGSPEYLVGLVYEVESGRTSLWHQLAHLRRLELIREGRLPRETVFPPARRAVGRSSAPAVN